MKKHYLKFGILYCLCVLIIFLVIIALFTRNKIKDVNNEKISSFSFAFCNNEETKVMFDEEIKDSDMDDEEKETVLDLFVNYTYHQWESQNKYYEPDDVGFYSAVYKSSDYSMLSELHNFIEISPDKNYAVVPDDTRYILTCDDFTYEDFNYYAYNIKIENASCDDVYIYDGEISWTDHQGNHISYSIDHPDHIKEAKSLSFDEWLNKADNIHDDYFHARYYCFGNNKSIKALNNAAKTISDSYFESYKTRKCKAYELMEKRGIFTSQAVYINNDKNVNAIVPYVIVFKPMRMVLKDNWKLYVIAFLLLAITEFAIIMSVRTLYLSQKSFEIRSQKLTRGIAHELKTPLAITKACVENWEYIDEKDRHEYSEKINTEVDHMAGMITKLLELSNISGGNVKMNREDIDVMELTKTIYNRMRDLARERKLDVTISGDDEFDEYPIYADLDMMNIVISNFMSNAIKYCDNKIQIKLKNSGKRVEFNIINDGAKIPRTELNKVWDVFYKTDESRSDRISSSGVGLAVVKNILEMHKARYGCDSGEGGTLFWFSMDTNKQTKKKR